MSLLDWTNWIHEKDNLILLSTNNIKITSAHNTSTTVRTHHSTNIDQLKDFYISNLKYCNMCLALAGAQIAFLIISKDDKCQIKVNIEIKVWCSKSVVVQENWRVQGLKFKIIISYKAC